DRNQLLSQYTDHWKQPGDQARNPQVIAGGNNHAGDTSSRWLFDDGYLRLKTTRIGYSFPPKLLSRLNIGLSSLSIYVTGRNLLTHKFGKHFPWDPEVRQSGFIEVTQQPLKTISLGINANF